LAIGGHPTLKWCSVGSLRATTAASTTQYSVASQKGGSSSSRVANGAPRYHVGARKPNASKIEERTQGGLQHPCRPRRHYRHECHKPMPTVKEQEVFPYYNGHSIGHFEGDTLVVYTVGFNEKTFVDATGAPHTDEMTTMERIRRISPTELEDVITIHDPQYYTRDWQARFVYKLRNDTRLEDYVCGEPHRDLASVAGVRRP
jgi:hypothetical protein